ncbi:hypothetical protein AB1E19_004768 [Capra hircus]
MGCKSAGASRIVGADLSKDKFEKAVAVGAAECINPKDFTKPVSEVLSEMTGDTMGYRFEVIGHVETMVLWKEKRLGLTLTIVYISGDLGKSYSSQVDEFLTQEARN